MKMTRFDWDEGNREKSRKHGVSVSEIEAVMKGTLIVAPDVRHSQKESRYLAVGRTPENRPICIVFTFRMKKGERLIRVVSARYMHDKEIKVMKKQGTREQRPTRVPVLTTDKEAEAFLEQDLSDLDYSQFRAVTFEFMAKTDKVNLRIPSPLLTAIKKQAKRAKMPYQRYIRQVLERDLRKSDLA